MVEGLVSMHMDKYKDSGAELVFGEGSFVGMRTIEVRLRNGGVRTLQGRPRVPQSGHSCGRPGHPWPSRRQTADPRRGTRTRSASQRHLIVLGGGTSVWNSPRHSSVSGSRVTVLERGSHVLPREDKDVAEALLEFLRLDGVDVRLNVEVARVEGGPGGSVRVDSCTSTGTSTSGRERHPCRHRPNSQYPEHRAGKTGVALDARGYIQVNERLETTAPGIWALGECAGSPQFTHVSEDDFRIVHANLHGGSRNTRDRLIPFCLFTDPEMARVGLNENEAVAAGRPYRVAKLPMEAVLRARTLSETRGFMKALVSQDNDEILGFTAVGPHAGEIVAVVQTAMMGKLPYTALRDAVFTHPTMAEGLGPLFGGVPSRTQTNATVGTAA